MENTEHSFRIFIDYCRSYFFCWRHREIEQNRHDMHWYGYLIKFEVDMFLSKYKFWVKPNNEDIPF
jgi:hypothetical protein